MKYIVIETPFGELGFTFNDFVVHKAVSESMLHMFVMKHNFKPSEVKTVAAGFVYADGECFGKSESLELASRDGDSSIIAR